jgi:hypothetical protein
LEETPERSLRFLSGVGTSSGIRTILASRGYSEAEHQQGWKLLHLATGYETPISPPRQNQAASQAIAEIDAWDEPNFRLARAALARRFPKQAEFLFQDLAAATGAAALLSVRTLLERLDMLDGKRAGRDHKNKADKKADEEAVALLATRGITTAERARLRKLLDTAESGAQPDPDAEKAAKEAAVQAARREEALLDLRGWFDEWSEVARVVITRRDYLIRLGLAKRKMNKKGEGTAEPGAGAAE